LVGQPALFPPLVLCRKFPVREIFFQHFPNTGDFAHPAMCTPSHVEIFLGVVCTLIVIPSSRSTRAASFMWTTDGRGKTASLVDAKAVVFALPLAFFAILRQKLSSSCGHRQQLHCAGAGFLGV
jgi:hypothetical protein